MKVSVQILSKANINRIETTETNKKIHQTWSKQFSPVLKTKDSKRSTYLEPMHAHMCTT